MSIIDPIDAVKALYKTVEKYNDVPLMNQVFELQKSLMELQQANHQLTKELQAASAKLALREKVSRRGPFFYIEGDSDPICAVCWENHGKCIHLGKVNESVGFKSRWCPVCRDKYYFD